MDYTGKKIVLSESAFDIWYVALPKGLLIRMFQLWTWGEKRPHPGVGVGVGMGARVTCFT